MSLSAQRAPLLCWSLKASLGLTDQAAYNLQQKQLGLFALRLTRDMSVTPSLPLELWTPILQYATCHLQLPTTEHIPFSRDEDILQARHTFNLAVKRSVVLVCKAWYTFAIPMLWETVHVNSLTKAEQVFLSLQNSEKATATTPPQSPFGLLVRHLYASHTFSLGPVRSEKLAQFVCRILERCPCLEVLCHAGPRPIFSYSIHAASHLEGNRLGKLDLGKVDTCLDMFVWELLAGCLSRFTCLETLILPLHNMTKIPPHITSKLRSTSLQTLVLAPGTYELLLTKPDRWHFPNLEDLHLSYTYQWFRGFTVNLSYVLSTVDAAIDDETDVLRARARSLDLLGLEAYTSHELQTLFALLAHFPNLRALRVQLVEMAAPLDVPAHFALQHVAVDWDCADFADYAARFSLREGRPLVPAQACAEHVGRTLDVLLAAELPELKVVRVCGRALGLLQLESEVVVGWQMRLRERGIEFRWG